MLFGWRLLLILLRIRRKSTWNPMAEISCSQVHRRESHGHEAEEMGIYFVTFVPETV